jgi:hypothetical protein
VTQRDDVGALCPSREVTIKGKPGIPYIAETEVLLDRPTMRASGYVIADPKTWQQKTVLVNPVSITIRGVGGKVREEITAARDSTEGRTRNS